MIPKKNQTLRKDVPASIVVFLVALPLCLGVALASGTPLLSGMIAGIVGGIVVGILSQSPLSVSGPAAGMAAIVLASLAQLGSFEALLLAVLISGVIQFIAGITRGGFIANYIPSNVIKGLLTAIGIILILKQIPHAVGFDRDLEDDFSFHQRDGENTFSELLNIFSYFSWGAIIISLLSLVVLIFWDKTPLKKLKFFPASLFVVVMGVSINKVFGDFFPSIEISSDHLVRIPEFKGIRSMITTPDFSRIGDLGVWTVAFTLAVVASLETLLNLEAIKNIDPLKRYVSPNRELIAQGTGNMISGLLGGIPITSVIVRSSVNLNVGAASKNSAIFHGFLLLSSLFLLGPLLNLIPLASLACILLLTGYKLAQVSVFKDMYKKGMNQFIPFLATVLSIVFTDLLIGVLIGLAISILFILKSNFRNPFVVQKESLHSGETMRLELPSQVSFLNKASIKNALWSAPVGSKVVIDAMQSEFIDHDVLEVIDDFKTTISKERKIKLNIVGLKKHYQIEDYIQFVNVLDREAQSKLQPLQILEILKMGNDRFVNGHLTKKYLMQQVSATSFGQNPFAIILSCIDSRTTTEHIFDLGLGDIFSIRIAGNILNDDILGSMEYGVHEIGVKLILVLGHTKCGAITGACNHLRLGHLSALLDKVNPAIERETSTLENRNGSNTTFVNKVAKLNVFHTIERIKAESEILSSLENLGQIKIVGALYEVDTGKVRFYDSQAGSDGTIHERAL